MNKFKSVINMKFFTVFLLIFISNLAFSQLDYVTNDYIINLNNDTIYGQIYSLNSKIKIKFKNGNEEKKIKANSLIGYKKGINVFKVKQIYDIPVFVKTVIEGNISLYEYTPNATYLIEKENTIIQVNNGMNYFKTTLTLFADYQELSKSIKNRGYRINDTPEIVRQYNYWTNNKSIDKYLTTSKFRGYPNGYIVLSNKVDTLFGYIQQQTNNSINYKDSIGEETLYLKREIVSYSFNNKVFYKIKVSNQKFLQVIYRGKVNLYSGSFQNAGSFDNQTGTYSGGGSRIEYFINKNGDSKTIKLNKNNLLEQFSDNEYLKKKIELGYYLLSDIETIAYIYNNYDQR